MKKVIISSLNPTKVQAVQDGFKKMFPAEVFEFIETTISSGVSDQPI